MAAFDTSEQPVQLVQAEAVDDILGTTRFLRFVPDGTDFKVGDIVLESVDSNTQVGVCRAFFVDPGVVQFLVTLDYQSPDCLLLEAGDLYLKVEYGFPLCHILMNQMVKEFGVKSAMLIRGPRPLVPGNNCILYLPLRPAKAWRWA